MEAFVAWLSQHAVAAMLAIGVVYAVAYVYSKRRELFRKK